MAGNLFLLSFNFSKAAVTPSRDTLKPTNKIVTFDATVMSYICSKVVPDNSLPLIGSADGKISLVEAQA